MTRSIPGASPRISAAAAVLMLLTGASHANPTTVANTPVGEVLTDAATGMTLYTFRNDSAGMSSCTGSCAESWPPFLAAQGARTDDGSTLIKRPDGTMQWATARGMPLYFWQGDKKPGDTTGDGVNGMWDAARK